MTLWGEHHTTKMGSIFIIMEKDQGSRMKNFIVYYKNKQIMRILIYRVTERCEESELMWKNLTNMQELCP